jgi:hypothetical protein
MEEDSSFPNTSVALFYHLDGGGRSQKEQF